MDIPTQIKQFILDTFLFSDAVEEIDSSQSFLASGTIDSMGVLELISFVEETYGIEVADEEIVPENFDSVHRLAEYVQRKLPTSIVTVG